jgi:RHS repeat-associated protein
MSQRRIITEYAADGSATSTTRLLWKDGRVWQEQDASGRMTKRYHFNGEQTLTYTGASTTPTSTTSTLTLSDHLGSHREVVSMVSNVPTLVGRRDFDPYGKATQVGSVPTNVAYTGHWLHERSGLELALYRAYDAELGRWLNEDPFGSVQSRMRAGFAVSEASKYYEMGIMDPELLPTGSNLYSYVGSTPLSLTDPDGEVAPLIIWGGGILLGLAIDYAVDRIKSRNVNKGYSCSLGTTGNAATGAATSATLPTQVKPRTGIAGGGSSGASTSVASNINHGLAARGTISVGTRNMATKCLRKVPYVGAAIGVYQLGDAFANPTPSNE